MHFCKEPKTRKICTRIWSRSLSVRIAGTFHLLLLRISTFHISYEAHLCPVSFHVWLLPSTPRSLHPRSPLWFGPSGVLTSGPWLVPRMCRPTSVSGRSSALSLSRPQWHCSPDSAEADGQERELGDLGLGLPYQPLWSSIRYVTVTLSGI